jgi:hypothetical protein
MTIDDIRNSVHKKLGIPHVGDVVKNPYGDNCHITELRYSHEYNSFTVHYVCRDYNITYRGQFWIKYFYVSDGVIYSKLLKRAVNNNS